MGAGARHRSGLVAGALLFVGYDALVRPRMLDWGASREERATHLPGDDVVAEVMTHHTRALTINATPEQVWPWLVQIGDHRAGFYSYDWVERFFFPGMVHRIEGKRSATRIHPELQHLAVGDRIEIGSLGKARVGNPVTVLEPNRALVIGSWAFILEPLPDGRTRLLVRERPLGYLKLLAPRRSGLLRAAGTLVDYLVGEPLHFAMGRRMMLGLKARSEGSAGTPSTTGPLATGAA